MSRRRLGSALALALALTALGACASDPYEPDLDIALSDWQQQQDQDFAQRGQAKESRQRPKSGTEDR